MPTLPGPLGPIPFTRDELGYPKIQARNRREAAYAIGWMHATDRLLQVQGCLAGRGTCHGGGWNRALCAAG